MNDIRKGIILSLNGDTTVTYEMCWSGTATVMDIVEHALRQGVAFGTIRCKCRYLPAYKAKLTYAGSNILSSKISDEVLRKRAVTVRATYCIGDRIDYDIEVQLTLPYKTPNLD